MKILSVDTSSSICSVAILEDNKVIKELLDENANTTHSVKLMPQVEEIFKETNLTLNDMDLLVCDKGPGSFTGIRIGISTIKAFHDVTNIPAIGITSLMGLAYNTDFKGYICSLIDAKNDNVYYGLFDNLTNMHIHKNEYLAENINSVTEILKICNKPIFFVGNGSIVYKDMLQSTLKENAIFPDDETCNNITAKSIGLAAFDIFSRNKLNEKDYNLSPIYLRKSNAERKLEEKQNGNTNK